MTHANDVASPALSVQNIWKVFGTDAAKFFAMAPNARTPEALIAAGLVPAVINASFDIAYGETFVIMGLSGSGKSTLLRCMTRLIEPTAGRVCLAGHDLTAASDSTLMAIRRKHMGMVFQNFALLPNRTVLGNICFPLEVQGMPHTNQLSKAHELIDLVGLSGRENSYPSALSGGQQQRIGIARSLATNADYWFLDEPFSALDPLIRADLQDEVMRLQKTLNKTAIFVTHDLDEAIRIADRIAIMENGHIVQIATPEVLVTEPATNYVRRFVSKIPPARVVRVRSIMDTTHEAMSEGAPIQQDATISAIAPRLLEAGSHLVVTNDEGDIVGRLQKRAALKVLISAAVSDEIAPRLSGLSADGAV